MKFCIMIESRPVNCLLLQKSLFLFLLICFFNSAKAQQQTIDSLLAELKEHPQIDTTRINILSELAVGYQSVFPDSTILLSKQAYTLSQKLGYELGVASALKHWANGLYLSLQYDEAIAKNKQALAIYEKLGNLKGCGATLNNIAVIKHYRGELDEALTFYKKSLEIRIKINDQTGIADCYNNIGNVYSDKGNLSEALYYLFKSLKVREKTNNPSGIASSYANIANVYFYLGKYEGALSYSLRAIKLHSQIGNKEGAIQSYVALGAVYHTQKKYTQALDYFSKALKLSEEMGNLNSVALCLTNIGDEYVNLQRYDDALPYYQKSLKLSQQSGDREGVAICHNGISKILIHHNKPLEAIEHLQISSRIAEEIGIKLMLLECSQSLANAYQKLGDYENMALALQKVITFKDSLLNEEVTKKTQELEFNFILDKKQKEIALLEKDRSIQQGISEKRLLANFSLTTVLVLSLALALSLWLSSKKVKKANKVTLKQKEEISRQAEELKALNALKDKIFSVLSHDLRSPIAALTGTMTLLDHDIMTLEEFGKMRAGMNSQLSALGLFLDNLLHWSRNHINGNMIVHRESIDIVPLIKQNLQLLDESIKLKNISIVVNHNPPAPVVVNADMNHVDIVIRNLVSNAIKFTKPNGRIEIRTERNEQTVTLSVNDNGVGMDSDLMNRLFTNTFYSKQGTLGEKGTGLGLLLCKDFAEQNGGTLKVSSKPGEGSTFYFTLPKT